MSKLLLNEQPLLIMPKLAQKIGLNESIIVQQIHYWNEINKKANKNFYEGYYWTFNTYDQWLEQFPFWSEKTLRRTITKLENIGLVVTANYNKLKIDRTKWYRIDYKMLESLEESPLGQNDQSMRSNSPKQTVKLTTPLPETNTETNSETKFIKGIFPNGENSTLSFSNKEINNSIIQKILSTKNSSYGYKEVINHFLDKFFMTFKKEHPIYTKETWEQIIDDLPNVTMAFNNFIDVDEEALILIIDQYFITKFQPGCDYHLLHFLSEGVKMRRMYEAAH